jgi:EAL and modified HD-GYP domain-containing signal transduction protein
MEEALSQVQVSDEIYDTLVNRNGAFNPVYQFILDYEAANWTNVSRMMIVRDVHTSEVYKAYLGAMVWYNKLLREE